MAKVLTHGAMGLSTLVNIRMDRNTAKAPLHMPMETSTSVNGRPTRGMAKRTYEVRFRRGQIMELLSVAIFILWHPVAALRSSKHIGLFKGPIARWIVLPLVQLWFVRRQVLGGCQRS